MQYIFVTLLLFVLFSVSTLAQSTRVSQMGDAVVAMPAKTELAGFDGFSINNIIRYPKPEDPRKAYFILGPLRKDRFTIRMDVAVVQSSSQAIEVATDLIPLSGEITTVQGSFTGRKVGTRFWHSTEGDLIYALDGRVAITVSLSASQRRSAEHPDIPGEVTKEERVFAEGLIVQVLDRMTAMGFTSKSALSASADAKKQVVERLKMLRLEMAVKSLRWVVSISIHPPLLQILSFR